MTRHMWWARWACVLVALALGTVAAEVLGQGPAPPADPASSDQQVLDAGDGGESSPSDATLQAPRGGESAAAAQQARAAKRTGPSKRDMLIASVTIFVLAIFVGFEVITKVPPTLHTPLMSGSNAISGITIVGALIVAGHAGGLAAVLGFFAVVLAMINVVGGFGVTHRMLSMFKKR